MTSTISPPLIDKDHIERKAHRCHGEGIPDLRGEDEQHTPTRGQGRMLAEPTPVYPWGPCQLDEKPSAEHLAGTQLDGRRYVRHYAYVRPVAHHTPQPSTGSSRHNPDQCGTSPRLRGRPRR